MELRFKPELEAKLADSATRQGRDASELIADALAQYLDEEARFVEAVQVGEDDFDRGDYLTHDQVGHILHRYLRS